MQHCTERVSFPKLRDRGKLFHVGWQISLPLKETGQQDYDLIDRMEFHTKGNKMTEAITAEPGARTTERRELKLKYLRVRSFSEELAARLSPEDMQLQSMPDASPTKWHLAHTTWFFETFLLKPYLASRTMVEDQFNYLYNSYYNAVGQQYPRADRGKISRPSVAEILHYRQCVDRSMEKLLDNQDNPTEVAALVELGLNHEQQHQELLLTDIKHALSFNPLCPSYAESRSDSRPSHSLPSEWVDFPERIVEIGHTGPGFCFDNELPAHRVLLHPFQLASRLVNCREFLEFMADGGYQRPELWLSEGWILCRQESWEAPPGWLPRDHEWDVFTLTGRRHMDLEEPVAHVSYFEAEAYARWAGCRLPTEFEWERAARGHDLNGNFVDSGRFHPAAAGAGEQPLRQLLGDLWEWTSSSYAPYPGYAPAEGAVGEYNGKFMCNQYVLRGGSCATSKDHIRPSYRNFFPAQARWQFSGIRLARSN